VGYIFLSSLYCAKAPDDTYIYLAVRATHETSARGAIRVW
jgi:hypothetical protein